MDSLGERLPNRRSYEELPKWDTDMTNKSASTTKPSKTRSRRKL